MKQFLLLTAYLVTTLTSFGQQGNVFHHSKQDRLHQRDNERSIIPSKQGNNLLAPSDLGSPPAVNWVKQFGGDGADIGQDIVTDASGNSYVTGYFSGPVSFGGTTLTSVGYTDAFVAKFNNTGSLLWIKQLSCNSYEMVKGFGIALDNAGHVFVTGFFNGVILHAGTVTLSKTGNEDLFIVKISPEGNISMGAHYGVPGQDRQGKSIAVDAEGNIFVINGGHSMEDLGCPYFTKFNAYGQILWEFANGAIFYDIQLKNFTVYLTGYIASTVVFGDIALTASAYKSEPFIAKCDASGDFFWAVQGNSTGSSSLRNRAFSLSLDDDENVYVAGRFRRNMMFGPLTLTNPTLDYTPYLVKCNTDGSFIWAKQADVSHSSSTSSYAKPVNISANDQGNTWLTCELLGATLDFGGYSVGGSGWCLVQYNNEGAEQWAAGTETAISAVSGTPSDRFLYTGTSGGNIVISRCEQEANPEWSFTTVGNSGVAQILNMETNETGDIYVIGTTDIPTALFGNTTGTFIARMGPARETIWSLPMAGGIVYKGGGDYISFDPDGDIFVMGHFTDTLTIGNYTITNPTQKEVPFIVKIDPLGNVQWIRQIGDGVYVFGYGLTADNAGNVIAAGTFSETFIIGDFALESAGSDDAFIVKYDGSGNLIWAKRAGGEDLEWSAYVTTDAMNNIYLTGEFCSRNVTIDTYPLPLTEFDGDVLLAKFTEDGTVQWANTYGGDPTGDINYGRFNCWATATKTDQSGNSFLYGWTGNANNYGPYFLESPYNYNFFLSKINNSGNVQWARIIKEKQYGLTSMQIDLDENGNVYFGGNFRDTLYFENNMVIPQGASDLFLAQYNNQGEPGWVKIFGSNPLGHAAMYNSSNDLNAIAVYDSVSLFIGGNTVYDMAFDDMILHSNASNGFFSLLGPDIHIGIVSPPEAAAGFPVYPNPASGTVNINSAGFGNQHLVLEIINPLGQVTYKNEWGINPGIISVDLWNQSPGVYFVRLQSENRVGNGRFIKQ